MAFYPQHTHRIAWVIPNKLVRHSVVVPSTMSFCVTLLLVEASSGGAARAGSWEEKRLWEQFCQENSFCK